MLGLAMHNLDLLHIFSDPILPRKQVRRQEHWWSPVDRLRNHNDWVIGNIGSDLELSDRSPLTADSQP